MKMFPILLLAVVAIAVVSNLGHTRTVSAGDDEFSIKLKGIDGKDHDTAKLRGNVLVISFGATWCVPCHAELRDLESLQTEFEQLPVRFIWVSIDKEEEWSNSELAKFAKSIKFTFPILRDPEKRAYRQFSERTRVPLIIFVDKEGRVVAPNHFGSSSQPGVFRMTIRNRLRKMLEKEPGANWVQQP